MKLNINIIKAIYNIEQLVKALRFFSEEPCQMPNYFRHLAKAPAENVAYIIKLNLNYEMTDENGDTLLHHLVRENKTTLVKALLPKMFDINFQNNEGRTALHYAALNNNIEMTRLLMSKSSLYLRDNSLMTPMDYANQAESKDAANILLTKMSIMNCIFDNAQSVLKAPSFSMN